MGTQTPWGKSDHSEKVTRGIIFYSTPSHGGYHLSKTLNALVNPVWRSADGWYEEDCDYAIVILTFPKLFKPEEVKGAHASAKHWHAKEYATAITSVS